MAQPPHNRPSIRRQWVEFLFEPNRFFKKILPTLMVISFLSYGAQHPDEANHTIGLLMQIGIVFGGMYMLLRAIFSKKKGKNNNH